MEAQHARLGQVAPAPRAVSSWRPQPQTISPPQHSPSCALPSLCSEQLLAVTEWRLQAEFLSGSFPQAVGKQVVVSSRKGEILVYCNPEGVPHGDMLVSPQTIPPPLDGA